MAPCVFAAVDGFLSVLRTIGFIDGLTAVIGPSSICPSQFVIYRMRAEAQVSIHLPELKSGKGNMVWVGILE